MVLNFFHFPALLWACGMTGGAARCLASSITQLHDCQFRYVSMVEKSKKGIEWIGGWIRDPKASEKRTWHDEPIISIVSDSLSRLPTSHSQIQFGQPHTTFVIHYADIFGLQIQTPKLEISTYWTIRWHVCFVFERFCSLPILYYLFHIFCRQPSYFPLNLWGMGAGRDKNENIYM